MDNKLQVNAKLGGKVTTKFNAIFQPKLKENEIHTSITEDSQIDFKCCEKTSHQLKFKPNLVSVHSDFGLFHHKLDLSNKTYNFWNNPYVFFEVSKLFKLNSAFIGNLFHINNCTRNNIRFNFWEALNGNKAFFYENNLLIEKNHFSFGLYDSVYISEKEKTVIGKFLVGWEKNEHSFALTGLTHQ